MLRQWRSQGHVRWYCGYHIIIVPKYRQRTPYGGALKLLGELLRKICTRYGVEVVEGHVMPDHVHMCLEIPPKTDVSEFIGKLKGKSTILLHQRYGRKKSFKGLNFWSRGYCVSTIGLKEAQVLEYIRAQERKDKEGLQSEMNYMW